MGLNDSKFNAKFVSGGYILLYDTGFYSEIKNGTVRCLKSKTVRYRFWTEMFKIEKRYSTAISRPILELLDLNDSKFNAKFVSGGYILLYDTGFYSEIKNGMVRRLKSKMVRYRFWT